ncbi:hypothetical protein BDZ97DRAFT_1753655 [Flammula alnicola]|nr:hypothetical protein BDZ97DRAFT_1753655 [Flammula alnicola]
MKPTEPPTADNGAISAPNLIEDNIPFAASSHPTTTVFISQEAMQYGLANAAYLTHMTCAEFEEYLFAHSPAQDASFVSSPNRQPTEEIPQQSETSSSPQYLYPEAQQAPFASTSSIQLQSLPPTGQEPSGVVGNETGAKTDGIAILIPSSVRLAPGPKPDSNQPIQCELCKVG